LEEQPSQTSRQCTLSGPVHPRRFTRLHRLTLIAACSLFSSPALTQTSTQTLPDAPDAKQARPASLPPAGSCQVHTQGGILAATAAAKALSLAGFTDASAQVASQPALKTVPCQISAPIVSWYTRFADGPQVKPLTPKEKAWLAIRNVSDPFNAITILGTSGLGVASDSHSPYGPGMPGFGKSVGVAYSQDMTGEFFGTFLIPSIVHQDPHYHRMPNASIPRRLLHCTTQVVWTLGDSGKGMLNYANLVGFAIDDEISNLYVPGRQTDLPASASRYGIGFALAPTDNLITEFLPDLARRIHVRVIFIQRIVNQVAKTDGPGT
jgi:hypothetical protein